MGVSNTSHICKRYFNLKGRKLQTIEYSRFFLRRYSGSNTANLARTFSSRSSSPWRR